MLRRYFQEAPVLPIAVSSPWGLPVLSLFSCGLQVHLSTGTHVWLPQMCCVSIRTRLFSFISTQTVQFVKLENAHWCKGFGESRGWGERLDTGLLDEPLKRRGWITRLEDMAGARFHLQQNCAVASAGCLHSRGKHTSQFPSTGDQTECPVVSEHGHKTDSWH